MKKTIALFLLLWITSGCAFSSYSRNEAEPKKPAPVVGESVETVVGRFGPPDKYIRIGGKEFLTYKSKSGAFVFMYGATSATELDLEFHDGKLARQQSVPAGKSIGIFAAQGSVAN